MPAQVTTALQLTLKCRGMQASSTHSSEAHRPNVHPCRLRAIHGARPTAIRAAEEYCRSLWSHWKVQPDGLELPSGDGCIVIDHERGLTLLPAAATIAQPHATLEGLVARTSHSPPSSQGTSMPSLSCSVRCKQLVEPVGVPNADGDPGISERSLQSNGLCDGTAFVGAVQDATIAHTAGITRLVPGTAHKGSHFVCVAICACRYLTREPFRWRRRG